MKQVFVIVVEHDDSIPYNEKEVKSVIEDPIMGLGLGVRATVMPGSSIKRVQILEEAE